MKLYEASAMFFIGIFISIVVCAFLVAYVLVAGALFIDGLLHAKS